MLKLNPAVAMSSATSQVAREPEGEQHFDVSIHTKLKAEASTPCSGVHCWYVNLITQTDYTCGSCGMKSGAGDIVMGCVQCALVVCKPCCRIANSPIVGEYRSSLVQQCAFRVTCAAVSAAAIAPLIGAYYHRAIAPFILPVNGISGGGVVAGGSVPGTGMASLVSAFGNPTTLLRAAWANGYKVAGVVALQRGLAVLGLAALAAREPQGPAPSWENSAYQSQLTFGSSSNAHGSFSLVNGVGIRLAVYALTPLTVAVACQSIDLHGTMFPGAGGILGLVAENFGLTGLYAGLIPLIIGDAVYASCYFGLQRLARKCGFVRTSIADADHSGEPVTTSSSSPVHSYVNSLAHVVACIASQPLHTVAGVAMVTHRPFAQCARFIMASKGIGGLFSGTFERCCLQATAFYLCSSLMYQTHEPTHNTVQLQRFLQAGSGSDNILPDHRFAGDTELVSKCLSIGW